MKQNQTLIEQEKKQVCGLFGSLFPIDPTFSSLYLRWRENFADQRQKVAQIEIFSRFFSAIARDTKVSATRTGAWQPEQVLRDSIAASACQVLVLVLVHEVLVLVLALVPAKC